MRLERVDQVNGKREASPFVTLRETDAQYFAEVAETDAVLAAYKRRESQRCLRGCHVGLGSVGLDDPLNVASPAQ